MFVFVSDKEYEIRKGEIRMSPQDVSELLEHSDVMIKWLKKNINNIRGQLALCQLQWREQEAYTSINCIKKLIADLEWTEEAYKKYVDELERLKDEKEKKK